MRRAWASDSDSGRDMARHLARSRRACSANCRRTRTSALGRAHPAPDDSSGDTLAGVSDSASLPPLDEQVRHRVADRVAWITLDRPEVGNAISAGQRDRVIELLADASARLDVGAVVLTA